ncbi:UNVERIFIED_CONTAM: YTH domain-containing protein ECT2 [Sesamum latifolium]|uniref:YTH domain-containing family protein n=1 Tax=Sesamum latifolium TaxID=2727402 RepID=A0AAW2VGF9_9LAMI
MEDANQRGHDPFAPCLLLYFVHIASECYLYFEKLWVALGDAGDRAVELHDVTEQPISPKDQRIVSANPSPDAAISGASRNAKKQPATSETSGALITSYPLNSATHQEQSYYYGGYNNGSGNWDEHSNYVNVNNLHVIPPGAMYNDNSSLFFPPGYGFDSQMAYGQLPPLASPLSPIMFEGQLFSPHQMPVTPPYYPPVSPGPPPVTSAFPAPQTELLPSGTSSQENLIDSATFGPGSGYYVPFGSFGGGDLSGSSGVGHYKFPGDYRSSEPLPSHSSSLDASKFMSPLPTGNLYPQPTGILGSYEQNVAQGFGLTPNSSARQFGHGVSYQSPSFYGYSQIRFATDRGGRREQDQETVSISTNALGMSSERNRGPRALRPKSKGSSSGIRDVESTSGLHVNRFNSPEFVTDYEHAKFFVIKSFSEDNIHRSIKYSIWASTPLGNRKLDAAYREAKEMKGICPVFLFFSVNASGQFCGVAEMVGPVDFDNNADYWQQDRWSGSFLSNGILSRMYQIVASGTYFLKIMTTSLLLTVEIHKRYCSLL